MLIEMHQASTAPPARFMSFDKNKALAAALTAYTKMSNRKESAGIIALTLFILVLKFLFVFEKFVIFVMILIL